MPAGRPMRLAVLWTRVGGPELLTSLGGASAKLPGSTPASPGEREIGEDDQRPVAPWLPRAKLSPWALVPYPPEETVESPSASNERVSEVKQADVRSAEVS